jgi:hypothetical protein
VLSCYMSAMKYTFEVLAPVVRSSTSYHEVLRSLGLKITGGSQGNIKRLVLKYQIDTSHFVGQHSRKGQRPHNRLHWTGILVRSDMDYRQSPRLLRRALLESGVPEQCHICGIGPVWCGRHLRLQVDHKDGDFQNNLQENLRFLCPNCHSQTDTFGLQKTDKRHAQMAEWQTQSVEGRPE